MFNHQAAKNDKSIPSSGQMSLRGAVSPEAVSLNYADFR